MDTSKSVDNGLLEVSARRIDDAPLFIFSPYPGTEIFRNLQDENRIDLNDDYFLALGVLNSSYFST